MIHVHEQRYEYLEEANEGILKQFPVKSVPDDNMVLDVGCGSGTLSEAIQGNGYTVWGIEAHEEACARAAGRITRVLNLDLESFTEVAAEIGGDRFDYLIFSDVLEHLYDPFLVLKEYLGFLKTGGIVLVSVPNAVVWSNRLKILLGRFEYSSTGVMDRTHIRFFTFKTARSLVLAAGCSIVREDFTPYLTRALLPLIKRVVLHGRDLEESGRSLLTDSPFYLCYMKYVYPVEYFLAKPWKSMFAFRIIIEGRKT